MRRPTRQGLKETWGGPTFRLQANCKAPTGWLSGERRWAVLEARDPGGANVGPEFGAYRLPGRLGHLALRRDRALGRRRRQRDQCTQGAMVAGVHGSSVVQRWRL